MSPKTNFHGVKRTLIASAIALTILPFASSTIFAQATAAEESTPRPKEDAVRLGTITIVGQGSKLGTGQLLNEDGTKARSTVTKEATEKDAATSNPYQALALLPSINTYNHDATGLFGGGLTMRGFGADQIGFTINGVPVNDSGSYSVFPQEYVDQENICTQTVQQGTGEFEAPHIGATGGSVGIVICDPEDKRRIRVTQTLGEQNLSRTFLRADSGRFANDRAKVFVSYSHSEADKWKGPGGAKRDHIDAAFKFDITSEHRILGSAMYNKAVNHNFLSMSLAQLNANGYYYDFSPTFPSGTGPAYYKLSTNPFENLVASLSGSFKLAESTYLKVQPYFWYGYGTGGTQQRSIRESGFLNTTTNLLGASRDLNGDGDTLDSVLVASSSVTKTTRPGITAEVNYQLAAHALKLGVWYERAEHLQTGPAVPVDANGNSYDVWLRDGRITRPDGSEYQSRDWKTISPAYQMYLADNFSALDDRLLVSVGVRTPRIERNFTNNANEGTGTTNIPTTAQKTYNVVKRFDAVLPQAGVRFNLNRESQVFLNAGKNFRAPPNFAFAPTNNNVRLVAGVPTFDGPIEAETSVITDAGYRFQGSTFTISATAFNVDFKNRQANATDLSTLRTIYTNAGRVNNRGFEIEFGTKPINGFSAYASFTSQKSKIKNDLRVGSVTPAVTPTNPTPVPVLISLQTTGKQFTLTPETMAGLSLQYSDGPAYVRVKAKHTGKQYATLMNDEQAPAYTTADLAAGYKLGNFTFVRDVQLRLNIANITNEKYRNPSSGSVTNAKAYGDARAQTVTYYLGAPRMTSVSISADF